MGKDRLFYRMIQTAALLILTALMCSASCLQPRIPEKRQEDTNTAPVCESRREEPERRLCEKKISGQEESVVSFGALYGLREYDIPEKVLDFAQLRREDNPHIYAWITIPGTGIDYPVVQHPEEPDYYLTHNLDGSQGYPGCIYTQPVNSKDFSDNQTVIYGHNMRNGTMFAGLHAYEEEGFLEENPVLYVYTEDSVRVYRIYAAFPFTDEHLLLSYDTVTQQGMEEFLRLTENAAREKGHYDEDAAPGAGEPIITLSTCIADQPSRRYLVQAVLEAEGKKTE